MCNFFNKLRFHDYNDIGFTDLKYQIESDAIIFLVYAFLPILVKFFLM